MPAARSNCCKSTRRSTSWTVRAPRGIARILQACIKKTRFMVSTGNPIQVSRTSWTSVLHQAAGAKC